MCLCCFDAKREHRLNCGTGRHEPKAVGGLGRAGQQRDVGWPDRVLGLQSRPRRSIGNDGKARRAQSGARVVGLADRPEGIENLA